MVDTHGQFVWYELTTTETEPAKSFYAKVMGWDADTSVPEAAYSVFTIGGSPVGGLMQLPEGAKELGARPRWIGYVAVEDVEAASNRVQQLGGTVYVPPTEIEGVSRFSIVTDPQAAGLGLLQWLQPRQESHERPQKLGYVGWHELLAANSEKAFAFYAELFGWQKAEAIAGPLGTYQRFSASGQTIGGMVMKPPNAVPFWLYYFNVEDVDAATVRVTENGGQIFYGPVDVPGGGSSILHCVDLQGAMFGLVGRRGYKTKVVVEPSASRDTLNWRKRPGL